MNQTRRILVAVSLLSSAFLSFPSSHASDKIPDLIPTSIVDLPGSPRQEFSAPINVGGRYDLLEYSPSGDFLAVGTSTGFCVLETKTYTKHFCRDLGYGADFLQFSSTNQEILVVSERILDGKLVRDGEVYKINGNLSYRLPRELRVARFSPRHDILVYVDGTSLKWASAATGTELQSNFLGSAHINPSLRFSDDGSLLAVAHAGFVSVFDANRRTMLWKFAERGESISLAFSADGETLASAWVGPWSNTPFRSEIQIWNAKTGQLRTTLLASDAVLGLDFYGNYLVSRAYYDLVEVWDWTRQSPIQKFYLTFLRRAGGYEVADVGLEMALLPNGVAVFRGCASVQAVDLLTGAKIGRLLHISSAVNGRLNGVSGMAVSPDQKTIVETFYSSSKLYVYKF